MHGIRMCCAEGEEAVVGDVVRHFGAERVVDLLPVDGLDVEQGVVGVDLLPEVVEDGGGGVCCFLGHEGFFAGGEENQQGKSDNYKGVKGGVKGGVKVGVKGDE